MYLLLFLLLIIPSVGQAAYLDQGTILRYEQDPNGSARLIVRFTGDAGEPIVDQAYAVTGGSSLQGLRRWIRANAEELNLKRTAGTAPQVAPSTVVQGLAAASPVAIAKTVWREKVESYRQHCTNSFTGSVATACTTLKTDIESTYQAGYLDAN